MRNLPADLSGPDKTHMCVRIWRGVSSVGEAKSLVEKSAYRTSGLKNGFCARICKAPRF